MALLKNVEKRIWDIEGFDVVVTHADGRDMRGDREGIPMYPYERMAKNSQTVSDWKNSRFYPNYPGLDVDVRNGDDTSANGNTLLSNVRDSYADN